VGCMAPAPERRDPFADMELGATPNVYKDLTLGVVVSSNTQAVREYLENTNAAMFLNPSAQFDSQAVFKGVIEILQKHFKKVVKIEKPEDAGANNVNLVAVLDIYASVGMQSRQDTKVDITAHFLTVGREKVDLVRGQGVKQVPWPAFSAMVSEASNEAQVNFQAALLHSEKLVAFAKSKDGSGTAIASLPEPPSNTVVIRASDVDRLPSLKSIAKKHAYAVVVGIEQYREKLPKADFADRDATLIGEYLTKVMGYPEENVVVRTNEKASLTDLIKYFENWLPNNVEKDSSVFVYYSGHGAPNPKTGDAYMVPYDGDPTFVDATGYPMKRLYAALDKLPVKDVTVVLDSCFSGAGGRSVLAKGAKPMGLSVEHSLGSTGKTLVLAASAGDQISSAYEEKGHGLLTYFFLKGLQGEGDLNQDGNIDMAEMYDYVKPNVSKVARKQYNNEQVPQLLANPDSLKKSGHLIERSTP